jgi:serine/threonine protein kinase
MRRSTILHALRYDILSIGYLPYFDENLADLYSKIIFEDIEIPSHVNRDAASLLKGILERSPNDRLTIDEILSHPWMIVRKLYAQDLDDLDWDVEYNLARSEALGSILDRVLVDEDACTLFGVKTEDEVREQLAMNETTELTP